MSIENNRFAKESLIAYLKNINGISPEYIWSKVEPFIVFKDVRKGTVFLRKGNIETKVRFMLSGISKTIQSYNDQSYVYNICDYQCLLIDSSSLFSNLPAHKTFETITRCTWFEIDKDIYINLLNTDFAFAVMNNAIINYRHLEYERFHHVFRLHSASERYHYLLHNHSEILKYVPMCDIASYLGITQQSLSRIRKDFVLVKSY